MSAPAHLRAHAPPARGPRSRARLQGSSHPPPKVRVGLAMVLLYSIIIGNPAGLAPIAEVLHDIKALATVGVIRSRLAGLDDQVLVQYPCARGLPIIFEFHI